MDQVREKISKIVTDLQNLEEEVQARMISIEFQLEDILTDIEKIEEQLSSDYKQL